MQRQAYPSLTSRMRKIREIAKIEEYDDHVLMWLATEFAIAQAIAEREQLRWEELN